MRTLQQIPATSLTVGAVLQIGDQFRNKRNKLWRPIFPVQIGRKITQRATKVALFRRPVLSA